MYIKRITLAEIKQEAKDLKTKEPKLKHTEALNKIAQKYGYEKYEILKAKAGKNCYIDMPMDIIEMLPFSRGNESFNPMKSITTEQAFGAISLATHGAYADVFNKPYPDMAMKKEEILYIISVLIEDIDIKNSAIIYLSVENDALIIKERKKDNHKIKVIGKTNDNKKFIYQSLISVIDLKSTITINSEYFEIMITCDGNIGIYIKKNKEAHESYLGKVLKVPFYKEQVK